MQPNITPVAGFCSHCKKWRYGYKIEDKLICANCVGILGIETPKKPKEVRTHKSYKPRKPKPPSNKPTLAQIKVLDIISQRQPIDTLDILDQLRAEKASSSYRYLGYVLLDLERKGIIVSRSGRWRGKNKQSNIYALIADRELVDCSKSLVEETLIDLVRNNPNKYYHRKLIIKVLELLENKVCASNVSMVITRLHREGYFIAKKSCLPDNNYKVLYYSINNKLLDKVQ